MKTVAEVEEAARKRLPVVINNQIGKLHGKVIGIYKGYVPNVNIRVIVMDYNNNCTYSGRIEEVEVDNEGENQAKID